MGALLILKCTDIHIWLIGRLLVSYRTSDVCSYPASANLARANPINFQLYQNIGSKRISKVALIFSPSVQKENVSIIFS